MAAVMDDSFGQHLENMITSDSDVLFCWTMITGEESLNENVLYELIKLWVMISGVFLCQVHRGKVQIGNKKEN